MSLKVCSQICVYFFERRKKTRLVGILARKKLYTADNHYKRVVSELQAVQMKDELGFRSYVECSGLRTNQERREIKSNFFRYFSNFLNFLHRQIE